MTKVFIDGSAGTAGLQIHQRLESRPDVDLITIPYEKRHDADVRSDAINASDVAFLCLPDDAARESASLVMPPAGSPIPDAMPAASSY